MALFKKSLIALILLVPFLFLGIGTNKLKAGYYESNIDEVGGDIYHVNVGNQRAYIHMTLPRYLNDRYVNSFETNSQHEIKFYDSMNIWFDRSIVNPDESIYNMFVIESKNENGEYVTEFYSRKSIYNNLRFTGTGDGIEISYRDERYMSESFYYLFDSTTYRLYWTVSNVYEDVTVDQLPVTSGSPFKKGSTGHVTFDIKGSYLDITIFYDNEYHLETKLIDDISIFENVASAYYYSDGESKFITLSYEHEPIFLNSISAEATPWADTITWNLTTNEIRSINKVEVFAYHTKDSERNIFTYMYIPDLVHENIISVTAGFQYQFDYYFTGKGEIQTDLVTLNAGAKNTYSPTWEKKLVSVYENSPYKYLDSLIYKALGMEDKTVRQIDQIFQMTNPSKELTDKITNAWNEKYDSNVVIDNNSNKLYKLNWGQYDKFGAKDVYLIEDSFNFAEIVFVSNGKINLLDFKDIILKDVIDDSLKPKENDFSIFGFLIDLITKYPVPATIIIVVFAFMLIIILSPFIAIFSTIVNVVIGFVSTLFKIVTIVVTKPLFWIILAIKLFVFLMIQII